jgi:hypothetical protein
MRRSAAGLLVCLGGLACTENFGDAPRVGARVAVRRAETIGPILPRAALALAGAGDRLWLATDRGIYRIDAAPASPIWSAEHPGYVTPQGDASPQFLQDVHAARSGRRIVHNVAIGVGEQDMVLFVSEDGGARYRDVGRPRIETRSVTHILALDPSAGLPDGGFLAVQGATVHRLRSAAPNWEDWPVPQQPLSIDAVGVAADGAALLAVTTGSGSEVWRAASDFVRTSFAAQERLLAVAADAGGAVVALSDTALWHDGERWPLADGEVVLAARLESGAEPRYALLTDRGLRCGVVGEPLADAVPTPVPAAPIAPLILAATSWLATPSGDLLRFAAGDFAQFAFAGADLWWSALGVDRRDDAALLLGNRNTGRVHRLQTGGGWEDLRASLLNSRAKFVVADAAPGDAIWLGSFGLYRGQASGGTPPFAWQKRTDGMQSYLLLGSEDLMEMQTIAFDPADPLHVLCGATEGNGPYESRDGGLSWQRVHTGLGTPGSIFDEDGLPNCSQVRAFVFESGETWMATFRGGVFERVGDAWQQRNVGLPDAQGAVVDTCCFAPLERVVDVRDLLPTPAGGLLAATGFGIFRDDERDGSWRPSSAGVTNSDLFALAAHPTRSDWILAAGRGSFDAVDWLFLSLDEGLSWQPVDAGPIAAYATDVEWIEGLSCVAILDGRGALRLELAP